jgi:hypothetical protein
MISVPSIVILKCPMQPELCHSLRRGRVNGSRAKDSGLTLRETGVFTIRHAPANHPASSDGRCGVLENLILKRDALPPRLPHGLQKGTGRIVIRITVTVHLIPRKSFGLHRNS